jgi:protein-S-isoprenylcysteine O-methyltransferase Ste14
MMRFNFGTAVDILWLVFFVYWIVAARYVNPMRTRESAARRLIYVLLMVAAVVVLNSDAAIFRSAGRRFLPRSYWSASAGLLLTAAGIGFAIWARNHIGKFWSASVAIREGHQLIRTGPYARIRHPIYTGILIAVAGTVMAVGTYPALVAFALVLVGLSYKARREELLLAREFGPAFDDHRRHTGFFLPRLS